VLAAELFEVVVEVVATGAVLLCGATLGMLVVVIVRDDVLEEAGVLCTELLAVGLLVIGLLVVGLLVNVHGVLEIESVQVVSSKTVPEGVAVPIVA